MYYVLRGRFRLVTLSALKPWSGEGWWGDGGFSTLYVGRKMPQKNFKVCPHFFVFVTFLKSLNHIDPMLAEDYCSNNRLIRAILPPPHVLVHYWLDLYLTQTVIIICLKLVAACGVKTAARTHVHKRSKMWNMNWLTSFNLSAHLSAHFATKVLPEKWQRYVLQEKVVNTTHVGVFSAQDNRF